MRYLQVTLALALALIGCRGAETFDGIEVILGTGGSSVGGGGMGNGEGSGGAMGGTGGMLVVDADVEDVPDDVPVEDVATVDMAIELQAPDVPGEQAPEVATEVAPDRPDAGIGPEPNLIGYWKFDDGVGATTLRDSSGNNNHATVAGTVTWTTSSANLPQLDFANPAAVVVGSGSANAIGTMVPANGASQTISVWMNSRGNGEQYILCLWNQAAQNAVALGLHSGQLAVWRWGGVTMVGTTPPAINLWHHVAYTYDGTTHRLYVDGKAVSTSTVTPNTAAVTRTEIGAYSNGGRFNGQLDDLRIYNIALTEIQIGKLAAGEFNATGP